MAYVRRYIFNLTRRDKDEMDITAILIDSAIAIVMGVLGFLLKSYVKENRKLRREKEEYEKTRAAAIENGMVCLLRKHLMDEHERWTEKGYITAKALESGLLMYKAYKMLGGNGMIDHMEDEIQELPIRD